MLAFLRVKLTLKLLKYSPKNEYEIADDERPRYVLDPLCVIQAADLQTSWHTQVL